MPTKILVTGGAGFIGSYVTRALLSEGLGVVIYDAHPKSNVLDMLLRPSSSGDVAIEAGEITDGPRLLDICRRHHVDAAVHLASPLTQDVTENPVAGIRDICTGTATLFAAAREAGLRRVVWTSSVAVFGPQSFYPAIPLPDDACHRPVSLYGSCKSLCENLAHRAHAVDGLDVVGLRLSVVYGAGRMRGYMSYPSHLMREAAAGEPVHVAFGRQQLHWQHVEEVAAMIQTVLASDAPGEGRSYNTPGDCRTWREAADALRLARPNLQITVGDELDPALRDAVEDYAAAAFAEAYGYKLRWPIEKGVRDTLDTYDMMRAAATPAPGIHP
jgi:UDP-glucose 4-epimerase